MRINIVIIGLIVWAIALSIPVRTLHAQSTSTWQTLPYQKQITQACFDTQCQIAAPMWCNTSSGLVLNGTRNTQAHRMKSCSDYWGISY